MRRASRHKKTCHDRTISVSMFVSQLLFTSHAITMHSYNSAMNAEGFEPSLLETVS